jgi:FAD/FMN-containing dehydrogenase
VIRATTVKQIQVGVNFASNTNIRLVVKNTGHEFSGRSGGAGSLSIWTHQLNSIQHIPDFKDDVMQYHGPAFRGGSGVLARDIYRAADEKGSVVVGGEGQDVGILGGYIHGGGHSPLSSVYGLAADQVLEMKVIIADGSFKTASSTQNTDLFWALRGGGGSTWGVVTSVTVRAHPSIQMTSVRFIFSAAPQVNFTAGVKAY